MIISITKNIFNTKKGIKSMISDSKIAFFERKSVDRKFNVYLFSSAYHITWGSDFVFNGENHEMWEVVFVNGGEVEVTEDEKVYLLKKNDIILHAPWEFHRIRSAGGTSPEVYVISFLADGELPSKLKEGIFSLDTEQSLQYIGIFDSIAMFLGDRSLSSYSGQAVADSLSGFLIALSGEKVSSLLDTSAAATEYRKIIVAMSDGICDNKALSDFAQECGASVSYIKQLFQKYAGISPKVYYNKLRVQHASKLIDNGESVKDIAEIMNFSSSNYFSSFFKKHTGMSPLEYKNKND